MGVTGLWKLVEQSGKPVPLETLENKVLAVDISIWLHQVIKGFQDSKGSSLPNAHILGLFHRLCKLMYYRIKPVFVFDGGVPALKRHTIAKRNQSKSKYHSEADRLQQLLLETLAKEKVVQQALGSATNLLVSPSKKPGNNSKTESEPDEMFKLPPLKEDSPFKNADSSNTDLDDSAGSWDEKSSKTYYHLNLNAIDVTSVHFKNLPADVRHDILSDIKETRKQNSWGRLHELPVESTNFSSFQMKRLLKRRAVQVELEEAEKEMGGKCLSLAELEALLSEEGVDTSSSQAAQKIASDENTRFLLVRDVQKAIESAKIKEEQEKNAPKPPKLIKKDAGSKSEPVEVLDDKEMDEELQLAIKMSLMQDEDPNVLINLEQEEVQMSKEQKEALGNAAQGLARGYMLEYGGMSNDDFRELIHQTQDVDPGEVEQSFTQMFDYNSVSVLKGTDDPQDKEEAEPSTEVLVSSDTDTDSDFIDVPTDDLDDMAPGVMLPLNPSNHLKPLYSTVVDFRLEDLKLNKDGKKVVEVVIDHSKIGVKDEEDIFADVFEPKMVEEADKSEPIGEKVSVPEIIQDIPEMTDQLPSVSKEQEKPTVTPILAGLKVKKVDDINARLQEELERLKAAPVINLDDISVNLDDDLPLVEPIPPIKKSVENSKPEAVHDSIKKQLELLKSQAPVINLDEIQLDDEVLVKEAEPTEVISDAEDSDATVSYSPMKEVRKILEASEQSLQNTIQSNEAEPEPLQVTDHGYDTPKKGTLEHLVVSRTPGSDSKKSEPEEDIPKVPKPFFVNKTPTSSSRKQPHQSPDTTPSKATKVSKELFPPSSEEPMPSTSKAPLPTAENMIADMADSLKDAKTPLELKKMALNLAQTERELEKEKNRQARLGTSITDQMQEDCMQLLRLFGVPYIVAPMEAEAQCAFLNQIQITDGTITDDSDIWLFGGQTVYKNFFNQQKLVLEFTADNIERLFQMDRKKLIQLALLVGSDYTTGINGIGAVTALEILASFPTTPEKDGETSEMMSLLSGLRKFRDWWNHGRNNSVGTRITLKSKLKNIEFTEGFPSSGVVEAYMFPTVDSNKEPFTWGYPDVESLRDFAKQKFGWPQAKFNDVMTPVIKRLDERKSQASIKNYFKVQSAVANNQLKVSKRVQHAVDAMAGKVTEEPAKSPKKKVTRKRKPKAGEPATDDDPGATQSGPSEVISLTQDSDDDFVEPKKTRGRKPAAAGKAKKAIPKSAKQTIAAGQSENPEADKPSTSLVNIGSIISKINDQSADKLGEDAAMSRKKAAKNKIPDFNPAIPQRLKDVEDMANRKQRAIELFKKSQAESKGKKTRK